MTKYTFLIPVYNDWQSLSLLLKNLNSELKSALKTGHILIIDDCSTIPPDITIDNLDNIKEIELLSLNKNLGSQKSIAIGLKHLENKNISEIITIMDSDGEDDPSKINEMINEAERNLDCVVTSNRTSRKESFIFKILYMFHKLLTFVLSSHWISYGNFSSFHSKNLSNILKNNKAWLAYSSAVSLNCRIKRVYAKRRERYYGQSKVNFLGLVLHSLRVISALHLNVILFSLSYLSIFILITIFFKSSIFLFLAISIIVFNLVLLFVKDKNNIKEFNKWQSFIKNKKILN